MHAHTTLPLLGLLSEPKSKNLVCLYLLSLLFIFTLLSLPTSWSIFNVPIPSQSLDNIHRRTCLEFHVTVHVSYCIDLCFPWWSRPPGAVLSISWWSLSLCSSSWYCTLYMCTSQASQDIFVIRWPGSRINANFWNHHKLISNNFNLVLSLSKSKSFIHFDNIQF